MIRSYVGERCRVQIPVHVNAPAGTRDLLALAGEALEAKCREAGCVSTDIRFISRTPWTEPIGTVDPQPGIDIYTYETTAAART